MANLETRDYLREDVPFSFLVEGVSFELLKSFQYLKLLARSTAFFRSIHTQTPALSRD